jgi:hypothetical protein
MTMKKKKIEYPIYQKNSEGLFAFTSDTTMYKISNRGTNKNEGYAIDYYITRKMVLRYFDPYGYSRIDEKTFVAFYHKIFDTILTKIINP